MGGLTDFEFQELANNQLNQDEWPDMKKLLQSWFSKHTSKQLDKQFEDKDCCVQRVLTEAQALKSPFLANQVVKGGKAKKLMTPVWKELIKECKIRDDIMILPASKL